MNEMTPPDQTSADEQLSLAESRHLFWWQRFLLGVGVWTLLGTSFALSSYLNALQNNVHIPWRRIFSAYLVDFYLWGLLSPVIFRLAKRFELRQRFPRNLSVHIGVSIVMTLVVLSAAAPLVWFFGYPNLARSPTLLDLWRDNAFSVYYFHQGLTIYWATLAVAHALHYYQGLRRGEARAARLSAQLAQAQLQALKMQIHPHFLFNTLNSISALIHKDVEAADAMIAKLGDFLRLTLKTSDAQTVRLVQEIEFLKCYLDIERIRFDDRLVVSFDIQPNALEHIVPNLILQPIVENAVRHGVARQPGVGRINVSAFDRNGRLNLQVQDNGPGLSVNPNAVNSGIGIRNTRARLQQSYGNDYRLDINEAPNGGAVVTLEIPATESAD